MFHLVNSLTPGTQYRFRLTELESGRFRWEFVALGYATRPIFLDAAWSRRCDRRSTTAFPVFSEAIPRVARIVRLLLAQAKRNGRKGAMTNFFVGIGVQKCATTWLYDILCDHPQAALSDRKELDFFSNYYGYGYKWYENHFSPNLQQQIYGEISPSYFVDQNVPQRLRVYAPEAKILVSLRDPVERAISNHRHEVRLGNMSGPDLSFEAGLNNNPLYIEQSRYGTHLQRWLEYFPMSQILIVIQDDIERKPAQVASQVYQFLGIDAGYISSALDVRSNESHVYRFRTLERVRRATRSATRAVGVDGLWRAGQRSGLQTLYRHLNRRPPETRIPVVSVETRLRLQYLLEDEIRIVEDMMGRQLPVWRREVADREKTGLCAGELGNVVSV